MDSLAEATTYAFDEFVVDLRACVLLRLDAQGRQTPVPIGRRGFSILRVLIERGGSFVSKQTLLDTIWAGVAVEENNLTVQISALRRALDAGRSGDSCIQNVPGLGYRFLPAVTPSAGATPDPCPEPAPVEDRQRQPEARPDPGSRDARSGGRSWVGGRVLAVAIGVLFAASAVSLLWHAGLSSPFGHRPAMSIVVLPFENLSGDPAQDYLADGITDDLTSDLAHIPLAQVIASASARAYQAKATDVRRIGQDLGVRYVVKGSVRPVGTTLRVNVQLTSTETGACLWSDRFDEQIANLASGQEPVLARMRDGLGISLVEIETARGLRERPTSPDAFDLIMRARSIRALPENSERNEQALKLFRQALEIDPNSVVALSGAGYLMAETKLDGYSWPSLEWRDETAALLARARAIAPNSERVLEFGLWWLLFNEHCQQAIPPARQFVQMYPNNRVGYYVLGRCETTVGHPEEEIKWLEQETRINPYDPYRFQNFRRRGFAALMLGRDREAIDLLEQSLALSSELPAGYRHYLYRFLSSAYARAGLLAQARHAAAEADRLWPFDTVRSHWPDELGSPVHVEQIRRYQDGLRLSGERDHVDEDADFGVPADDALHPQLAGYTPTTVPGAKTIRTNDLLHLLSASKPLVLDTLHYSWGRSIPGAVGLRDAGMGGSFTDRAQAHLKQKMMELTAGDTDRPIVAVGWNAERFDGRNLALRLAALGYSDVYWYRGGRESWEANGLPETEVTPTEW